MRVLGVPPGLELAQAQFGLLGGGRLVDAPQVGGDLFPAFRLRRKSGFMELAAQMAVLVRQGIGRLVRSPEPDREVVLEGRSLRAAALGRQGSGAHPKAEPRQRLPDKPRRQRLRIRQRSWPRKRLTSSPANRRALRLRCSRPQLASPSHARPSEAAVVGEIFAAIRLMLGHIALAPTCSMHCEAEPNGLRMMSLMMLVSSRYPLTRSAPAWRVCPRCRGTGLTVPVASLCATRPTSGGLHRA